MRDIRRGQSWADWSKSLCVTLGIAILAATCLWVYVANDGPSRGVAIFRSIQLGTARHANTPPLAEQGSSNALHLAAVNKLPRTKSLLEATAQTEAYLHFYGIAILLIPVLVYRLFLLFLPTEKMTACVARLCDGGVVSVLAWATLWYLLGCLEQTIFGCLALTLLPGLYYSYSDRLVKSLVAAAAVPVIAMLTWVAMAWLTGVYTISFYWEALQYAAGICFVLLFGYALLFPFMRFHWLEWKASHTERRDGCKESREGRTGSTS